jgi:hypothetical protein
VADGEVVEGFDPAAPQTRAKIETLLMEWGLDPERFAPEIDSVIYSRMTVDDIRQWRAEAVFSDAMVERLTDEDRPVFSFERLINRQVMDARTKIRCSGSSKASRTATSSI